jgi:hypothetical protein
MLDGRNTVRAIIETFAREYQLNLREAEVSILAYLRMLAGRGMMVLAVEKTPQEGTDTRGRS